MVRVASGLVLIAAVVGTVWFLPPVATLVLAIIAAALAFHEYTIIAAALGARVPRIAGGAIVVAACAAAGGLQFPPVIALMTAVVLVGALAVASGRPGEAILRDSAATLFPALYIGLPLGALAGIRAMAGAEAVLLLMATIVISDSAQYYCGRAFGKRPLAPSISPKKTLEGAVGGIIFGTAAMTILAGRLFPGVAIAMLVAASATNVALGIVGDLFESLLKRSAGVKDSSSLIPGHGGVLDRIDSWLFASPVFFVFVLYVV